MSLWMDLGGTWVGDRGLVHSKDSNSLYHDALCLLLSPGGPDGSCDSTFSSGISVFTPAG